MGKKYLDENGLAYFWSKLKQYLATTSRAGLMSPTDKAKVDAITNQGTVSYHKKYEGTFTTTGSSTSTIPIPISSYSTADILLVDINGLDLVENTDYTISGTDIVLTNPITESGQIVHFVAVRATTASVSDYALLKGDAGVVDAYPISGATPLSASWLSDTSGGSALTPEANQIYILMSDSGDYTANALFRWNGTAYVPLTSGGSVTSTSVPTANTISEFDSTAHMNSTDMTAQEVQDFVDNLDAHGGIDYTSTPVPIGKLNGKVIYRRVFTGNTPSSSGGTVFTDACLNTFLRMSGYVLNTGSSRLTLPAYYVSASDHMTMYAQGNAMKFVMGNTSVLGNRPYVCIVDYLEP